MSSTKQPDASELTTYQRIEELEAENKRLRDVYEAAKRARETDKHGLLSVEKGWDLDRALAALEGE